MEGVNKLACKMCEHGVPIKHIHGYGAIHPSYEHQGGKWVENWIAFRYCEDNPNSKEDWGGSGEDGEAD